jgi:hypothetical protein
MQSHLSNPWNNAVAFLSMLFGEQEISTGSCFFWRHDGRTYLVTNWHNLAGRNPLTGQPMSPTGGIPDRVRFMAYKRVSAPDVHGYFELAYVPVEVPLCKSDFTGPKWFEHPSLGRKVDVAALDVTEAANGLQIDYVNVLENDAVLDPIASQEVFVVGFPFGLIANAPAPIWKRGSIALDPTFNPEGLPKMLIRHCDPRRHVWIRGHRKAYRHRRSALPQKGWHQAENRLVFQTRLGRRHLLWSALPGS